MSEKRKWFDPAEKQEPLVMPTALHNNSHVSEQTCRLFLSSLHNYRSPSLMIKTFASLAGMPPHVRLARNLKKLLDRLVETEGDNFLSDGLDVDEKYYLRLLQTRTPDIREVAERLLNLTERYQLFLATRSMFQRTRAVTWKPERLETDS